MAAKKSKKTTYLVYEPSKVAEYGPDALWVLDATDETNAVEQYLDEADRIDGLLDRDVAVAVQLLGPAKYRATRTLKLEEI